jgi:hypothetical protein
MYDDVVNDPKVLKLSSDTLRWQWVAILCIASKNDGKLPPIDDIAITMRLSKQRTGVILTELQRAGLIDKRDDGALVPHNWDGRQYKSDVKDPTAAQRNKRCRDRKRNATAHDDRNDRIATVSVIRPESESETETETETEADKIDDAGERSWRRRG